MNAYTIIDARGEMLRAFHASQKDTGVPDWKEALALLVQNLLLPLFGQDKFPPQNTLAAWDAGNTYRLDLYPGYKAKRRAKASADRKEDPEADQQVGMLQEQTIRLFSSLGIWNVTAPGQEADDLIALLVDRLEYDVCMIRTEDEDLSQMVGPKVGMVSKRRTYELGKELNKDLIPFSLVPLHKALVGDSSDEYGGVPKFGPVKFKELLSAYGADGLQQIHRGIAADDWKDIQGAYEATKDSNLQLILENWSQAVLSLKLSTVNPDVCYGNHLGKEARRPRFKAAVPDRDAVTGILTEIGQKHLIGGFEHLFPTEHLVLGTEEGVADLVSIMDEVLASPIIAWDYESTDKLKYEPFTRAKKQGKYVDVLSQEITGLSINYGKYMEHTVYLPVDHKDTQNLPVEWVNWVVGNLFEAPQGTVVQNANFELTLTKTNLEQKPPAAPFDTVIMASYVDENLLAGLKDSSKHYLGYDQATYEETTQGKDICELTGEEVLSYGCDDSLVTARLFQLYRMIMQIEGSWAFYAANERQPALDDVEDFIDGQEIDYELLNKLQKDSSEAIRDAMVGMRAGLADHVNNVTQDDVLPWATMLFNEWWATAKFKADGDADKEIALRQTLWEKAWNSCFYELYCETTSAPLFVSSPTMINKVIGLLDKNAPKLEKASGPGVDDLEARMANYLSNDRGIENFDKLEEFISLLFSAKRKLSASARSGEAYEALREFCQGIFNNAGQGKVEKKGTELNTNADWQMQSLLYGMLKLPIRKRSKVGPTSLRRQHDLPGAPATGLKAIAAAFVYDIEKDDDWRADVMKSYRTVALEQQKHSLYFNSYPLWKRPDTGRIHPQIRNCGTKTRRPSGSDPNVLQVSKKDEAALRKVYLSGDYGDGPRLTVSSDFTNQELVITACESGDETMLEAFMSDPRKDVHALTSTGYAHILLPRLGCECTGEQFGYEPFHDMLHGRMGEELQKGAKEIRNKYSKAVNFLICYLGGYTTLAGNLLIPGQLAKDLMNSTFSMYPRLQPWQQETIEFARTHGYTQTAYGNRRHATADLWSKDDFLRTRMERQVVNAVVQGTAADILKVVRQEMHVRKMRERYATKATRPVYDEVTASVPVDRVPDYCRELVEVMEVTPPGYPVGMKAELSIGTTWGDQIELKGTSSEEIEEVVGRLTG